VLRLRIDDATGMIVRAGIGHDLLEGSILFRNIVSHDRLERMNEE
jgi:hypothetical protein